MISWGPARSCLLPFPVLIIFLFCLLLSKMGPVQPPRQRLGTWWSIGASGAFWTMFHTYETGRARRRRWIRVVWDNPWVGWTAAPCHFCLTFCLNLSHSHQCHSKCCLSCRSESSNKS